MKRTINLVSAIIILIFLTSFSSGTSSWEKAKEKDGVTVLTREVEHSPLKEFKAYTTINASVEELMSILIKFESYPHWMHNYTTTKVLEKINEDEYIYYAVMSAPWPVWNRDVVIHFKKKKTEYGYLVTVNNKHKYIDEQEDCVRIKHFKGTWELHNLDGKTKVVSQVHADPSGKIPSWLANSIIVDGPISTLSAMRDIAE